MLAVLLHATAESIPGELLPEAKTSDPMQNLGTEQRPVAWQARFNTQ